VEVVLLKMQVFQNVTPCGFVNSYHHYMWHNIPEDLHCQTLSCGCRFRMSTYYSFFSFTTLDCIIPTTLDLVYPVCMQPSPPLYISTLSLCLYLYIIVHSITLVLTQAHVLTVIFNM